MRYMDMKRRVSAMAVVLLVGACLWPSRAGAAENAVISLDGTELAVPVGPRKAEVLDASGAPLATFVLDGDLVQLAFSRDGRKLAACLADGGLAVLDIAAKSVKKAAGESGTHCRAVFWTPQGALIYVVARRDGQEPVESSVEVRTFSGDGASRTLHSAKTEHPSRAAGKKEESDQTVRPKYPPAKNEPLVVPPPPPSGPATGPVDSGRRGNRP